MTVKESSNAHDQEWDIEPYTLTHSRTPHYQQFLQR